MGWGDEEGKNLVNILVFKNKWCVWIVNVIIWILVCGILKRNVVELFVY